jgi:hypothetical protein
METYGPLVFVSNAVDFDTGESLDELWIDDVRVDGESVDPAWLYFPADSGAILDGTRIVCFPPCELLEGYGPRSGSMEIELDLSGPGHSPRTMIITSNYEKVASGPCGNHHEGTADIVVAMAPF